MPLLLCICDNRASATFIHLLLIHSTGIYSQYCGSGPEAKWKTKDSYLSLKDPRLPKIPYNKDNIWIWKNSQGREGSTHPSNMGRKGEAVVEIWLSEHPLATLLISPLRNTRLPNDREARWIFPIGPWTNGIIITKGLLKMQILGTHCRPTESEFHDGEGRNMGLGLCFMNMPHSDSDAHKATKQDTRDWKMKLRMGILRPRHNNEDCF